MRVSKYRRARRVDQSIMSEAGGARKTMPRRRRQQQQQEATETWVEGGIAAGACKGGAWRMGARVVLWGSARRDVWLSGASPPVFLKAESRRRCDGGGRGRQGARGGRQSAVLLVVVIAEHGFGRFAGRGRSMIQVGPAK